MDAWNERADKVASFVKEKGIDYTVLLDGAAIAQRYRIRGVPTSFLIDRQGRIADSEEGPVDPAALEGKIKGLLPERKG